MNSQSSKIAGLKSFAEKVFAPMIQALKIEPVEITQNGAKFTVPASDFTVRTGNVICGQALASIADTVGVMTLFAHNEDDQRIMTTVDMTTHFMRPLPKGTLDVETIIHSNGRRMANVQILITQQGKDKPAASTTCAYIYI